MKRPERTAAGLRRSFVDTLAWLIVSAWSVSFIADMAVPSYEPPPAVHALMLTVAGSAFASTLVRRTSDGPREDQ